MNLIERYVLSESTEGDLKAALKKSRTWFTLDDFGGKSALLSTRENGDVGSERYGSEDMSEGRRLKAWLEFNLPGWTWKLDYMDEWVTLDGTFLDPNRPLDAREKNELGKANVWAMDVEMDGGKVPRAIEKLIKRGHSRKPSESREILKWFYSTAPGNY